MDLRDVTYQGPPLDDNDTLSRLPPGLRDLLEQVNGFVQFGGGLHIRGACRTPAWHALGSIWFGENALVRSYASVLETDVPFGQDALGDQFLLRDDKVYRLFGETGEMETLDCGLMEFLGRAQSDPVGYLSLHPLLQFQWSGKSLLPGQLLNAWPPFCTEQAASGVSLAAVPAEERLGLLAHFAAQIAPLKDGQTFSVKVR